MFFLLWFAGLLSIKSIPFSIPFLSPSILPSSQFCHETFALHWPFSLLPSSSFNAHKVCPPLWMFFPSKVLGDASDPSIDPSPPPSSPIQDFALKNSMLSPFSTSHTFSSSAVNTSFKPPTKSRVVRFSQFEEQQDWEEPAQLAAAQTTPLTVPNMMNSNDRIEIKETDMKPNMVTQAMDIVRDGCQKHNQDKDIASFVKDSLERQFGPTWHCVVGKSFGSRVSYELETFALLKVNNQLTVLVFKCG